MARTPGWSALEATAPITCGEEFHRCPQDTPMAPWRTALLLAFLGAACGQTKLVALPPVDGPVGPEEYLRRIPPEPPARVVLITMRGFCEGAPCAKHALVIGDELVRGLGRGHLRRAPIRDRSTLAALEVPGHVLEFWSGRTFGPPIQVDLVMWTATLRQGGRTFRFQYRNPWLHGPPYDAAEELLHAVAPLMEDD